MEELEKPINAHQFSIVPQPDLVWIQRTMKDLLAQLCYNATPRLANKGKEKDRIIRLWGRVDRAFDDINAETLS